MMKLALLQCDVVCGDLDGNRHKIAAMACGAGDVDLCIIASQALTGPGRLAEKMPDFSWRMERALDQLAAGMANGPGLLGHAPEIGYFLVRGGVWNKVEHIFEFGNLRLGVDLRPEDASAIDVGIAMAPRSFAPGANDEWELILSGFCRQNCIWGVSVNLCGGYGGEIYAGQSMAMGPDGVLAAKAKAFAEDCLVVDLAAPYGDMRIESSPVCWQEAVCQAMMLGLRDFVVKAGAEQVLLGLSGGMDSALVASVAAKALGSQNVTGVLMPSPYTSRESVLDARELAKNLGIRTLEIPITPMLETFTKALEPAYAQLSEAPGQLSHENLQARLRGVALMALANYSGALVLNCGNKSEGAMGYSTLYGDTVGAVAVIGDLYKTQVYALADWLCVSEGMQIIPKSIFEKEPSAELRPGQKDTDSLPPYVELDPLLHCLEQPRTAQGENGAELENLAKKVAAAAFKRRQSPPVLRVGGMPPVGF